MIMNSKKKTLNSNLKNIYIWRKKIKSKHNTLEAAISNNSDLLKRVSFNYYRNWLLGEILIIIVFFLGFMDVLCRGEARE